MQASDVLIAAGILHIAGSQFYQLLPSARLSVEPDDVAVPPGVDSVILKCRYWNGSVAWFRNGKSVVESDGYHIMENGDLVIKGLDRKTYNEEYYCQVSVPHVGVVRSRTAKLQTMYVGDKLQVPLRDLTVYEGNTAYFPCLLDTTISQQLINFTWYSSMHTNCTPGSLVRHECQLRESEEMVFLPGGGLIIPRVSALFQKKETFCCGVRYPPASNKGPFCAQLTVLPSSGVSQAPTVDVKRNNITIQAGNDVIIPCVGKGVPPLHVSWYKPNGKLVKSKEKCKVRVTEPGILKIKNAKLRNSGVYQCIVRGMLGANDTSVTTNVTIIVSDVPRVNCSFNDTIWVKRTTEAKLLCPIVNGTLSSVSITWLVNGTVINKTQEKFSLLSSDTLIISDVQFADEGMYQCLVENEFGNVQTTFRLRTKGPPGRVENMKLKNVPGDVVLSWMPGYPGCQTKECAINGYLVTVISKESGWSSKPRNIAASVRVACLFSEGFLPYSESHQTERYEISVKARNLIDSGTATREYRDIVLGQKQSDIQVGLFHSTSVRIKYTLPKQPIMRQSCKVCVNYAEKQLPHSRHQDWLSTCQRCSQDPIDRDYANKQQTSHVSGLKSLTDYQFYVVAEWKGPFRSVTSYMQQCGTGLAAPPQPPVLQKALRLNSTAFLIVYQGIDMSDLRDLSYFYQLYLSSETDAIPIHTIPLQPASATRNRTASVVVDGSLHNLSPWKDYELSMRTCCNLSSCKNWAEQSSCETTHVKLENLCNKFCKCSGQHSARVFTKPHDIHFEEVHLVNITNISAESATISWQSINNSLVSGYMVNISDDWKRHYISKNTSASHLFVPELQPQTKYNVTVSVWTFDRQNALAQSKPATFVTRHGVRPAPRNLAVREGDQLNSVYISWEPVLHRNVDITGYNVSLCDSIQRCLLQRAEATDNSTVVHGLLPRTTYQVRVSAMFEDSVEQWSSFVPYTTPSFVQPPEIVHICFEIRGVIHLTCHISGCLGCQPHRLNVSICQSTKSDCIYATFDATNFKYHTTNSRSGTNVSIVVRGLDLTNHTNTIAVGYVDHNGHSPPVWSRIITFADHLLCPQQGNTTGSDNSDATRGASWIIAVAIVLTLLFISLVVVVILTVRRRQRKNEKAVEGRPDRVSTVSSVAPRHKISLAYEDPNADADDDEDYTELEEGAIKQPGVQRNRVCNQGDHTPPLGLYLKDCSQDRHVTRERRRKLLGRWKRRGRKNREESDVGKEIALSELNSHPEHQPQHSSDSDDDLVSESIASASERGRRVAVTHQPVIVQICPQSMPDKPRHDHSDQHEYSSDLDDSLDKPHFNDQDKSTTYVQLEHIPSLHQSFQQSDNSKDSIDEDEEPPLKPSPVSLDSVGDEHQDSKSESSRIPSNSDCSSQEDILEALKVLGDQDSDIGSSDDEFEETPRRESVTCSGDYVSGSSMGESSAYTGMSSYSPPQLHRPHLNTNASQDYI